MHKFPAKIIEVRSRVYESCRLAVVWWSLDLLVVLEEPQKIGRPD